MMVDADETKRPSRRGYPLRTQDTTTPAGTHSHDFALPTWIKPALVGCGIAILALAVAVTFLMVYIIGRGQVREQQIRDTRDQVRDSLCDVLDGLPQGGVLDITRDRLGCGPGLPLDSFSPEDRARLDPSPAPQASPATTQPPAPSTSAPEPPPAPSAAPELPPAPDAPVAPPAGAQGPMTGTQPPPLSPPSQVRELICGLLPICPQEP